MKRAPLKRRTALARTPMKRRARRARKPGDSDPRYLAHLRRLPCAMCDAPPPSHAHHHSMKQRGRGQKAADRYAFPLCEPKCHTGGLHMLAGCFKGWHKEQLRAWQDEMCAKYRSAYERSKEAA